MSEHYVKICASFLRRARERHVKAERIDNYRCKAADKIRVHTRSTVSPRIAGSWLTSINQCINLIRPGFDHRQLRLRFYITASVNLSKMRS